MSKNKANVSKIDSFFSHAEEEKTEVTPAVSEDFHTDDTEHTSHTQHEYDTQHTDITHNTVHTSNTHKNSEQESPAGDGSGAATESIPAVDELLAEVKKAGGIEATYSDLLDFLKQKESAKSGQPAAGSGSPKRRPGRPKKEVKKDARIQLLITSELKGQLATLAWMERISVNELINRTLQKEVKRRRKDLDEAKTITGGEAES